MNDVLAIKVSKNGTRKRLTTKRKRSRITVAYSKLSDLTEDEKERLEILGIRRENQAALFNRESYLDDIVALKALQLLERKYPNVGGSAQFYWRTYPIYAQKFLPLQPRFFIVCRQTITWRQSQLLRMWSFIWILLHLDPSHPMQ